ncbi:hypothetical protein J6590_018863, partial [Homalodisca vitripennis]
NNERPMPLIVPDLLVYSRHFQRSVNVLKQEGRRSPELPESVETGNSRAYEFIVAHPVIRIRSQKRLEFRSFQLVEVSN